MSEVVVEMGEKTVEDVLRGLSAVVAREGRETKYADRVTRLALACRYVDEATYAPLCLIGVLLVEEWGVKPQVLVNHNTYGINRVLPFLGLNATPAALRMLESAQETQDLSGTWGEALDKAIFTANHDTFAWEGR